MRIYQKTSKLPLVMQVDGVSDANTRKVVETFLAWADWRLNAKLATFDWSKYQWQTLDYMEGRQDSGGEFEEDIAALFMKDLDCQTNGSELEEVWRQSQRRKR